MKNIVKYFKHNYLAVLSFIVMLLILAVVIAVICIIVIGYHYCAQEPKFEGVNDVCTYIEHFVLTNAPIVGIISGFVGIIAAFWFLRPRFHMTKALALSNSNQLKVQICNDLYFTSLTDIKVELDFVRYINDGKDARTKRISINKDDLTIIYGRLKGTDKCYYTVHTEGGFVWNKKYEYIRCRVAATNNITGVASVEESWFKEENMNYGAFNDDQFVNHSQLPVARDFRNILKKIYLAVEPIKDIDYEERIECVSNALKQMEDFETEEFQQIYPSLKCNIDVANLIKIELQKLLLFYTNRRRLNPKNAEERKQTIDIIIKNAIYLAEQMENDI